MNRNVLIKTTGTYSPKKVIDNSYYIDHFKQYNKDGEARKFFEKLGRSKRMVADENENTLTMSVESSKEALKNSGLDINDIDIIISATNSPEYLTPCCAIMINNALKGSAKVCFDVNCDCISMLHGVDIASKMLKLDKKYKRALVVGSYLYNRYCRDDDVLTYATNGDNSTAIILEVEEEIEERGFMGSVTLTDSDYAKYFRFPRCGLSKILDSNISTYDKLLQWDHFNDDYLPYNWAKIMTEVLKEQNLSPSDVTHFFMSQFSLEEVKLTMDVLKCSYDKFTFIADKFGYTGPSSPFLAYHCKTQNTTFNKNDINIFCSVGGGYSMTALLYKW